MGKSTNIKKESEVNEEFQNYLDDLQKKMAERVAAESGDFDAKVAEYYASGEDVHIIADGEKWDFRQLHDIGAENVANMIQSTVYALFDGRASDDEPGQTVGTSGLSDDLVAAFRTINAFRDVAANFAVSLVVGAMKLLSSEMEIKFSHQYTATSLAPGLTMHITVASDSYTDSRFLQGERIFESYVRFKLIYSFARGNLAYQIDNFNEQEKSLSKMVKMVAERAELIMEDFMSGKVDYDTAAKLDAQLELFRRMVDKARADIRLTMKSCGYDPSALESQPVRALPPRMPSPERMAGLDDRGRRLVRTLVALSAA